MAQAEPKLLDAVTIDRANFASMLGKTNESTDHNQQLDDFHLRITLNSSNITVRFYDDHSVVIADAPKNKPDKPNFEITVKGDQITRLTVPKERVVMEYQYTKGGAVHIKKHEEGKEEFMRDMAHPASGNMEDYVYAAMIALRNANEAARAAFDVASLERIRSDGAKARENAPSVPRENVLDGRVLGTREWLKREKVKQSGFSSRLETENYPLTLMIESELGNCLSEMKLPKGANLLRHDQESQDLAIAFATPKDMETYMKGAKKYLRRELRDSDSSSSGVQFSPSEEQLLENARQNPCRQDKTARIICLGHLLNTITTGGTRLTA